MTTTISVSRAVVPRSPRSGRLRDRMVGNVASLTERSQTSFVEGTPAVKKGRHRRFEEARKLKQAGPGAFDLGLGGSGGLNQPSSQDDDDYAALAEKYGVTFDDDEDDDDD